MNKILRWLKQLIALYLLKFFWLFVKNKKYFIISSWGWFSFYGNPKAFFQYLVENKKDENFFYMFKNKKLYNKYKKIYPWKVFYLYNLKGFIKALKAKLFIIDSYDLVYYNLKNAFILNLRHGIPLKKIGKHKKTNQWLYHKILNIFGLWTFNYNTNNFTFAISSSKLQPTFEKAYGIKNFLNSWYPRTDKFFNFKSKTNNQEIKILYAPTWREYSQFIKFIDTKDKILQLGKLLKEKNTKLFIKKHPHTQDILFPISTEELEKYNLFYKNDIEDINDFLLETDLLITDYSSIILDYVILKRPYVFYLFDYEDYITKRGGFYFNIWEGELIDWKIAYNSVELIQQINNFLKNPTKFFEEEKKHINNMLNYFYEHQDWKSSERVFNYIKNHFSKVT